MLTSCSYPWWIYNVQSNAMTFSPTADDVVHKRQRSARSIYKKVLGQRKHAIRGLWARNGRYYAQITVEDSTTGIKRVKRDLLEWAARDAQAAAKFHELLTQQRKGSLPVLDRTRKCAD
jgi:hypothetical protein